jgi:hypothetical protein
MRHSKFCSVLHWSFLSIQVRDVCVFIHPGGMKRSSPMRILLSECQPCIFSLAKNSKVKSTCQMISTSSSTWTRLLQGSSLFLRRFDYLTQSNTSTWPITPVCAGIAIPSKPPLVPHIHFTSPQPCCLPHAALIICSQLIMVVCTEFHNLTYNVSIHFCERTNVLVYI